MSPSDGQGVLDEHGQAASGGLSDLGDVEGDLRDQLARAGIVEETGRQPHEAPEHLRAQVHDDLLRHPVDGHITRVGDRTAKNEQQDDEARDGEPCGGVACDEGAVEQRLQERRQGRFGSGQDHHARDRDREGPAVGEDIAQEPSIQLRARER